MKCPKCGGRMLPIEIGITGSRIIVVLECEKCRHRIRVSSLTPLENYYRHRLIARVGGVA